MTVAATEAGGGAPGSRRAGEQLQLVARTRVRDLLLGPAVPVVVVGTAAVVFLLQNLLDYLDYRSGAYDLGFFDQVVERTAQGHPFQTSFLGYSFLGQHWEPILGLWAGLDRLVATPVWLLAISTLALALTPVVAWRLARAWLGRSWAAPVAALACLADPLIGRGATFGYHSEALTPLLALAALDGAARGHRWQFLLPALALVAVKEDALLVAAGVGWIAWSVHGRRDALLLSAGMLAAFAVLIGVVMPALRGGESGDLSGLYSYLGGTTPAAVAGGLLTHPQTALGHLVGGDALRGAAAALLPLALLPLAAGRAALAFVPVLLIALLSANPWQDQLLLHYGLEAFPLLLACGLLGWKRLRSVRPLGEPALAFSTLAALCAGYVLASPLPGGLHADAAPLAGLARHSAVEAVLAEVPIGASVSASTGLVPHLSARDRIYEFPDRAGETEYVVLDKWGPRAAWTLPGWDRAAEDLPTDGYRLVAEAEGISLWAR